MSLNTIREVTEITGITVNALRYYDSKGLLCKKSEKRFTVFAASDECLFYGRFSVHMCL